MKKILFALAAIFFFFFISLSPEKILAIEKNSDRLIIKFKNQTSQNTKNSFFSTHKLRRIENEKLKDTYVVTVEKGKLNETIKIFAQNKDLEYVEPDFVAQALEIPNDTYYSQQWGLTKIQANYAWDTTHGALSALIAIVDTGIDGNHPDLLGKVIDRTNFTTDPDADGNGHGTHVSGIASALTNNNLGVAGVGYNTSLLSVKVLDNSGSGYYSWVANGIVWAADRGAKVINLSLGGTSSSTTLSNAINYAWGKGAVIVASAGNNNTSRRSYPAYYTNVIATAATDQNDKKASFSNYGNWVDVAAPGVSILSTYQGSYANLSGTSMSAPFVSGLASLVFSINPAWTNSQVRNKIESTADKITGTKKYWTYGRINACRAVDCSLTSPTPTLTPTPSPIPTSTPAPTVTPTPISTQSANLTPEPTSTPKPWWCKYIPDHSSCQ